MWKSDTPIACFACGQTMRTLDDVGGLCIICRNLFCARHAVIRNGVANCAACEEVRQRREAEGPISQADADRVVRLLQHDLVETVGDGQEAVLAEAAARIRMFSEDPQDFEQRVVDDVQQCLHDTFVDTSWPACPEHSNHPLWYSEGWWRCGKSGRRAALLGALRRGPG